MSADPRELLETGDLDWALAELLQLTWEAKRTGVMPHLYNPPLFHSCLYVIYSYPHEIRKACWEIWQEMEPTNVYANWRPRAHARAR